MTDTKKFDNIRDEATRVAMYELWRTTRDGVREINASLDQLSERIDGLEQRIIAIENRR